MTKSKIEMEAEGYADYDKLWIKYVGGLDIIDDWSDCPADDIAKDAYIAGAKKLAELLEEKVEKLKRYNGLNIMDVEMIPLSALREIMGEEK